VALAASHVEAHSALSCLHSKPGTRINTANGVPNSYASNCLAPVRNYGWMIQKTEYNFGGNANGNGRPEQVNNPCEFKFPGWKGVTSLSQFYNNGRGCGGDTWDVACQAEMGQLASGQDITVWWEARNHAAKSHQHKTVKFFISGANPTEDPSKSEFESNGMFCELPYDSGCEGGTGQRPCSGTCTLPQLQAGAEYTVWWYWPWKFAGEPSNHNGLETYANCADFMATTGGGGGGGTPTTSAPTSPPPSGSQPACPSSPQGCWHWQPTGCNPTGQSSWTTGFQFVRDEWGEENEGAGTSETICLARNTAINNYCNKADTVMCFSGQTVSQPTSYEWNEGLWSGCSAMCDGGTMTKTVTCQDEKGNPVADSMCLQSELPKPRTSKPCNTNPCAGGGGGGGGGGETIEFSVKVQVKVSIKVRDAEVSTFLNNFVSDASTLLDIPPGAISNVVLDYDESRKSNSHTYFDFSIKTIKQADGSYTDPVALAAELKDFSANPEAVESFETLYGLQVVSDEEEKPNLGGAMHVAPALVAVLATVACFI
jgi:hypothetical protein